MNIVIGIVLVVCLMISELELAKFELGKWNQWLAILMTSMLPSMAALCHATVLHKVSSKAHSYSDGDLRKIALTGSAFWIMGSLTMVLFLDWQGLVRATLNPAAWPLVDELLILLPMFVSLIGSWVVMYFLSAPPESSTWKRCFQYVALHLRVYLAMTVVPIIFVVVIRDLSSEFESITGVTAIVGIVASLLTILAIFPFVMLFVWRHSRLEESETRDEILGICSRTQINIFDVRIWNTGNQVVNAVVAGTIPKLRILMLSDKLLTSFPQHEVAAIVRHEAGHIRLRHLQIRILFVMLPILAILIASWLSGAIYNNSFWSMGFETQLNDTSILSLAGIALYGVYVLLVVAWLSKKMEYEADLFAIGAFDANVEDISRIDARLEPINLAQSMVDALLRFAADNPDQYEKKSLTHPSIRQRVDMIARAAANRDTAIEFRRQFVRDQIWVGIVLLSTICMILSMSSLV